MIFILVILWQKILNVSAVGDFSDTAFYATDTCVILKHLIVPVGNKDTEDHRILQTKMDCAIADKA